jgi:hypothetical protein
VSISSCSTFGRNSKTKFNILEVGGTVRIPGYNADGSVIKPEVSTDSTVDEIPENLEDPDDDSFSQAGNF